MIRISRNLDNVDWSQVAMLIERAPLGAREPVGLRLSFENSYAITIVRVGKELVGLGRAISDGYYQAAIYDVVVAPEHQGTGVGRLLMEDLHDQLNGIENIILYAAPGKEDFYKKLGYRRLKTGMAILSPSLSRPSAGYVDG